MSPVRGVLEKPWGDGKGEKGEPQTIRSLLNKQETLKVRRTIAGGPWGEGEKRARGFPTKKEGGGN